MLNKIFQHSTINTKAEDNVKIFCNVKEFILKIRAINWLPKLKRPVKKIFKEQDLFIFELLKKDNLSSK